ncbi:unnamed protein product [Fraxinus pennsylvanica]|uniref:Uncharacterized protein n=1 Tax=Fraxinus pennsylvanica TaxID=56036 RepID=A0AAD1ZWC9_9LAMI|nr:unnamed protein product [Fraxinus pennsylvanica]
MVGTEIPYIDDIIGYSILHSLVLHSNLRVFLILQLTSVIEFITWWNNFWMPDDRNKSRQVNRGLLSSGIMASYIMFLCWTAIRSEPASEKCSPQKQENAHGLICNLFHAIFDSASAYRASSLLYKCSTSLTRKWSIEVGWASTWVKIVNEWFCSHHILVETDFSCCEAEQDHEP